ncbi:MAG: 1-acyl-sn-glycerol-3-phosphate acyltransferase, partial [Nitrospinae bacterium]|nr:1-acyl-sn-glycerol-3-phosphate acyltransferase [Nitrospinota bacterium]
MNAQLPSTLPSSGQPTWLKKIFQAGLRLAYGGVDVQGMHNVPPDGPLIVASNHRSYLDPMILASFLPRRVYHMAKRELFRNPLFAKLITYYGAFPVDREGTARASTFRMARTLLGLNGVVVIFPEGGIVDSTTEVEVKEGVATLAAMSRAPVLPVYIAGSNTLISPRGILDPWLVIRVG